MTRRIAPFLGFPTSRRARGSLALPAALAAGALVLSACSGNANGPNHQPTTNGSGSSLNTLILANAVKVDTLDPRENSVNESIWLDQNLYARLVQPDPTGTKIVPGLAKSWDISKDRLTYTFHLRKAKFSDGTPITAQDAKFSIERARKFSGGWGFLITPVKTITAANPTTLTITLSQPHAPLLADLAMYAYSVVPQKGVASDPKFFTHPVTSGPFTVSSYNPDSEVDLKRNPYYYGPKPKISKVKVLVVPNDNTRVLMLQSKKVDVIENPPGNLLKQISANPQLKVDLFPSTRVDFVQLSTKSKQFSNLYVRQAMHYAIDLNQINQLAYQGKAIPATSFMPYKMLYWNANLKPYPVNLKKAKALLAKGGFPNGFKTNIITVSGDAAGQAEAIVIKNDLAKIGITVHIESYELLTAYNKEQTGNYGLGERYWTNDIIDPDEVATFGVDVNAGSNSFDTYWSDKTATRLVNQARSETDPTKRQQMYDQIQKIVYDQTPYLPIAYPPFRYASGRWVHGFHVSPLGNYNDSLLTLTVSSH